MAQTTGYVQRLNLVIGVSAISTACIFVGDVPGDVELFFITFDGSDATRVLGFKKSLIAMLLKAKIAGEPATVTHGSDDAEITAVTLGGFDISPVGRAIRGDFYSVTGTNIPENAEFVFENETTIVTVTPSMVRPHWAFLSELPSAVPLGRNLVSLEGPGYSSDQVPIDVFAEPLQRVRALYTGAPKTRPYTIVIVANPIFELESRGEYGSDPILANRPGFHDIVRFCLTNLLTVGEDLLRQDDMDAEIRFVAIFDEVLGEDNDANALVRLDPPNLIRPRQSRFEAYIGRYFERPDVAFAVSGSITHTRASANFTQDDETRAGTNFTYDEVDHVHRHFADVPGACTLSLFGNQNGLTALHEFGHMASDVSNGTVVDLYVNGGPGGFQVNRKFRDSSSDPIPANFGNYNGSNHGSDPNRDSIGYPSEWTSYHPAQIDPNLPNLMDNYWLAASSQIQNCRFDQLTHDWFSDRLRAKIFR